MNARQRTAYEAPCYRAWETTSERFKDVNYTGPNGAVTTLVTVNR